MPDPDLLSIQGQQEFEAVSRSAFWRDLAAVLTGRERSLLPLEDVVQAAHRTGQIEAGVHDIPLLQIRGSEGRTRDFDASFLPLKRHLRDRWIRVYMAVDMGHEMPPIDVYQVGGVYFVKDGHHRVSIAITCEFPAYAYQPSHLGCSLGPARQSTQFPGSKDSGEAGYQMSFKKIGV